MLKFLTVVMCFMMLSACSESDKKTESADMSIAVDSAMVDADALAAKSVEEIILDAELVYRQAKEMEHAWTVTSKHIAMARKLLSEGHKDDALVSAERALMTAEASLAQAKRENIAWRDRALKSS